MCSDAGAPREEARKPFDHLGKPIITFLDRLTIIKTSSPTQRHKRIGDIAELLGAEEGLVVCPDDT
jgi:hypothetical protein